MIKRLLDWFDDRTGSRQLLHEALYERIPGGARWRYVWGSTLVFTFFVQVVTGIVLWTAYSPSTRTAWESVFYLQHEMHLGWLVRGIHHFAAQAMVVLLVVHLMQVVIDGAYRAPREINFWLGLILMQIVLGLGLTGYLLPWDQKGYYATQVATEIMGSTPMIGPAVQKLMQGGSEYGHHTLTRFFALHAGVLPGLLVFFLVLHLLAFRRQGITVPNAKRAPETTFWPDQVLKDGVACLAVLAAIMGLAIWTHTQGDPHLTAPANPAEAYSAARPEWYYLFLFRFLKFEWVSHAGEVTGLGEAFGAVVIPGILMLFLVLMPLIGRWKIGHRFNVLYLFVVMLGAGGLTGLAIYEDWFAETPEGIGFRAAVEQAHLEGERTIELARSPGGIPPAGAIALLQSDPLTQGPRVFEMACRSCHQPAADDGPQQAPALVDLEHPRETVFASREWTRSVLTDFAGHFESLSNITEENGATEERAEAAEAILDGSMYYWSSDNLAVLEDEANAADVDALIEFLYTQTRRRDALPPEDEQVQRGRQIFMDGEMTAGTIEICADCHRMTALGDEDPISEEEDAPDLTGYGNAEWLRRFITDPAEFYVDYNAMPAFGDQLTSAQLNVLARWIAGAYYSDPEATDTGE